MWAVMEFLSQIKLEKAAAGTAIAAQLKQDRAYVWNEIGISNRDCLHLVGLAASKKAVRLGAEPIVEGKAIVEHEIEIAEHIDDRRHRGYREQSRRTRAAAVEMLPPGLERANRLLACHSNVTFLSSSFQIEVAPPPSTAKIISSNNTRCGLRLEPGAI